MPEAARLVTAEELERFPSDDRRYELVEGRLVAMTPVSYAHSRTVMRFGSMLEQHARERQRKCDAAKNLPAAAARCCGGFFERRIHGTKRRRHQ